MRTVLEHLAEKHESLANDYHKPEEEFTKTCFGIALEVARGLIAEGKTPHILIVDSVNWQKIIPKRYNGKIKWEAHMVCCAEGIIYDPLLGKPVPKKDYCQMAFGEDLRMEVEVPERELLSDDFWKGQRVPEWQ